MLSIPRLIVQFPESIMVIDIMKDKDKREMMFLLELPHVRDTDFIKQEKEINFETILREENKISNILSKKEEKNLILLKKKTYAFFENVIREPKVKQVL